MDWKRIIVFLLPFVLAGVGVFMWFAFLRKTIRARLRMQTQLRNDPDINEWLVVFGWSRKVLYMPLILVSLLVGVLMMIQESDAALGLDPYVIGGIWLAVFFLNFLVDEY